MMTASLRLGSLCVALGCLASTSVHAAAGPDLSKVRDAIVIVSSKGVLTKLGSAPVASQATGFFVSMDGFLVTSYHLRTELGEVDEATVEYQVHFGPNSGDTFQAKPVYVNPVADLMVLYSSVGGRDIKILSLGSRAGVNPGTTPVYTVGYPAGDQYSMDSGIIKSFGGPIDATPVWTTSLTFKAGQSGSPILLDNLRVIAIARGNDADAPSVGLIVNARIVPPNFWDGTLNLAPNVESELLAGQPNALGHINVEASVPAPSSIGKQQTFTVQNELCQKATTKPFRVTAPPGFTIDPASIKVDMLEYTGTSPHWAVTDRAADGFTVYVELTNIGGCVQVFGKQIEGGVAAKFTGKVSYTVQPVAGSEQFVTVASATAIGNVQSPLPDLPVGKLKFSATKPSGEVVPFEPKAGELTRKNGVLLLNNSAVVERLFK